MSPLIKWAGGKRGFAASVMASMLPEDFGDLAYVEPMVGGAAAFLAHGTAAPSSHLADVNFALIETYKQVRDNPDTVLSILDGLPVSRGDYDGIRQDFNHWVKEAKAGREYDPEVVAAGMLYLNRYCFNGLYRENAKGSFNVPWGKRAELRFDNAYKDRLRALSGALQGVEIRCSPVKKIRDWCPENAFLFVDPPYVTKGEFEAKGGFTSYSAGGYTEADLRLLSGLMKWLVKHRGCKVMVTHSDVRVARDVFSWMTPRPVLSQYTVSRSGASRGDVAELAFTSY